MLFVCMFTCIISIILIYIIHTAILFLRTRQFMFTLVGLTKTLPDKSKDILKNINLSFYPGAKIGVVGLNGSGKVCFCFDTDCVFLRLICKHAPYLIP